MHESWSSSGTLTVAVPLKMCLCKQTLYYSVRKAQQWQWFVSISFLQRKSTLKKQPCCLCVGGLYVDTWRFEQTDRLFMLLQDTSLDHILISRYKLDLGLPSLCRRHLHSSAVLHDLRSSLVTNISGNTVGLIAAQVLQVELEVDAIGRRLRFVFHTPCICHMITYVMLHYYMQAQCVKHSSKMSRLCWVADRMSE